VERASHGVPSRQVIERVAPHLPVREEAARVEALHAATGGEALPGAAALLARDDVAVVTSGSHGLAEARLASAGLPQPRVLITSDDTERGKPHPDPYLAAAAAAGADPADCVVIEDAPAGIVAALAAGMTAWAVTTTHAAHELEGAQLIAADVATLLGG
jgi:sugar-phosphatase